MRTIDITNKTGVELWPGRRLYVPSELLIALPRGAMHKSGRTISFGNANRSTVAITADQERIDTLFGFLVDSEKPDTEKGYVL